MTEDENKSVHSIYGSRNEEQAGVQPVVLKYKKRKQQKKDTGDDAKAKYSRGLEDIQILGGNILRVAQTTSKAVSKAIDTYERERKRSSKEKTDGAYEDFVYNSAKAASDFMKETSGLPLDLAEAVNTKSYRKRVRRGLRRSSRIMRFWRM
jgi:hypothetical protein